MCRYDGRLYASKSTLTTALGEDSASLPRGCSDQRKRTALGDPKACFGTHSAQQVRPPKRSSLRSPSPLILEACVTEAWTTVGPSLSAKVGYSGYCGYMPGQSGCATVTRPVT